MSSPSGRATINPNAPRALGICDGCGFMFNLDDLQWQMYWCGVSLQNKHLRKCETCLDIPNEQFRTIILPPDPPPINDVRIEPFAIDEQNNYTIRPTFGVIAEVLITLTSAPPEIGYILLENGDILTAENNDRLILE